MSKSLVYSVVLRGVDLLTGPLRGVARTVTEVDRAAGDTPGLREMAKAMAILDRASGHSSDPLSRAARGIHRVEAAAGGVSELRPMARGVTELDAAARKVAKPLNDAARAISHVDQAADAAPDLRPMARAMAELDAAGGQVSAPLDAATRSMREVTGAASVTPALRPMALAMAELNAAAEPASKPLGGVARAITDVQQAAAGTPAIKAVADATAATGRAAIGVPERLDGVAKAIGAADARASRPQGFRALTQAAQEVSRTVASLPTPAAAAQRAINSVDERSARPRGLRALSEAIKQTSGDAAKLPDPLRATERGISHVDDTAGQAVRPLRSAARAVADLDHAAARVEGIRSMSRALDDVGDKAQRFGAMSAGAGAGLGATLGLQDVPGNAVEAEHQLQQMGNVAEMGRRELRGLNVDLLKLGSSVNQTQGELITGMSVLVSKGMGFRDIRSVLPDIGRTATGMTADIEALGTTVFAMTDNLKVPVSQVRAALGVTAQAGQMGAFELRDMASVFPQLTASAQALGMKGVPAVSRLGAALQVALKGAGTPEQAFNNFNNFLGKLTAPETVKNFKDMGVNLEAEWKRIAASGKDPIEEMVALIQRTTKGNEFKLGELFGDAQVLGFIKPFQANIEEYRRIRDTSLQRGQTGELIDKNFAAMMTTTREQSKQFRINMEAAARAEVDGPLGHFNEILRRINADPKLQQGLLRTVMGLVGVGAVSIGVGTATKVFAPVVAGVGHVSAGVSILRAGYAGTAVEGGRFAQMLRGAGSTASGVRPALASVNVALRGQLSSAAAAARGIFGSRYQMWWHIATTRAWAAETAKAAAGSIRSIPGRVAAVATATRTWTMAQLANGRAMVGSVFSVQTYVAMFGAVRARVLGAATWLRSLTIAHVANRAATLASAAASKIAAAATWVFNTALLANPLVWVGAAIAGVAFLIYKYWKPISAFARGMWRGFMEGVAPLAPLVRAAGAAIGAALRPVIGFIRPILGWFGRLLKPVDDVGGAAESMGMRWGRAIGGIIVFVARLVGTFFRAGSNIITSLVNGMKSVASKPVELIRAVMQRVRNHLPFSPAKEGPLRDIHRIRLIETIAESVKPAPMVRAMRAATAATLAAAAVNPTPSLTGVLRPQLGDQVNLNRFEAAASSRAGGANVPAGRSGPLVELTYTPTYNVAAGAGGSDVLEQLRSFDAVQRRELQRLVDQAVRDALAGRELRSA